MMMMIIISVNWQSWLCAGGWKLIIGPQHRNSPWSCRCRRSTFRVPGVTAVNQKVL